MSESKIALSEEQLLSLGNQYASAGSEYYNYLDNLIMHCNKNA